MLPPSALFNRLISQLPPRVARLLVVLIPAFFVSWWLERSLSSSSNLVPIVVALWLSIKYGRHKRKMLVEEMNQSRKWLIQNTRPITPLEPCEWLNKLIINIWPNYMEPKLCHRFAAMMMKKLISRKPKFIEKIELEEFSLGLAPPVVGLDCTYWAKEGDEDVFHTGFDWDTNEMNILLALTVTCGAIKKRVHVAVNSLHVKGDIRIVPVLEGRCLLYSFESAPEVRIGVAFGGDSDSCPAIELPGIAYLLETIMVKILSKMMVEPQRSCFSFPVVNLNKHVSGAIVCVTVFCGVNLNEEVNNSRKLVEIRMDKVSRKTCFSEHGKSLPIWDETFDMTLDGSMGSIYMDVLEEGPGKSALQSIGNCKIKMKYVQDDSTIFWSCGRNNGSIATRAAHPGEMVEMAVPLEGSTSGEVIVKLVVKQWNFVDDPVTRSSNGLLGSLSSFQSTTGRIIKVTVEEARNLAAKDKSGASDPYIVLQYGKTVRKTRTIFHNLNPTWNQTFEFAEIIGEEYIKLKCYDADMFIDDSLGSARVNLEGLQDGASREIWVPLENIDIGEVRLKITTVPSQLDIDKSKARTTSNGILELVLVEARNLIAADLCGTSDPFVSVHYGKQRKRTKVVYKNLNPQWNQTLEFPDDGKQLELRVKDHNTLLPTSDIGHCVVEHKDLPKNKTVDMWIPLLDVRKGEIHVQVTRRYRGKSIHNNDYVNADSILSGTSSKILELVKEAHQLAEDGDMIQLYQKLAEIELIEHEQNTQILKVIKEKKVLISRTNKLPQTFEI